MVHTFPKGISPKVNVIVQLEFELTMMSQSNTLAIMPWELILLVLNIIFNYPNFSYNKHNYETLVKILDSFLGSCYNKT